MNPGGFGDSPVGATSKPCPRANNPNAPVHWVGIELKDESGKPVPDEPYRVTLSTGEVVRGFLDKDGKARIEGVETLADCQVSFPGLDSDAW